MALDRGQSGTDLGNSVVVRHTRRPHDNQGARLQRDQFLTQELTYFVLDTGQPTAGGNPAHGERDDHPNANVYLTGYYANGEMRPAEKIINVLSSFMNPVIIDAIDLYEETGGADQAANIAASRGNTRLLYFACEVDGLHWDSDDDANGNVSETYGEIGANSATGNAQMSTAAQAIRAIRALDTTDLGNAKISRGYFRVSSDRNEQID